MADYDDIHLDAETLRRIEEEAMREADQELATDPDLMRSIEEEALRQTSVDDIELDDEFLDELQQELANLDVGDVDISDVDLNSLDLDDIDLSDLQPDDAPATVTDTDSGSVRRAKAKAKQKVRKRMVETAAEQIRQTQGDIPKSASIEMLEAEIQSKSNTLKAALIFVIVIVVLGGIGAAAILASRLGDNNEPTTPDTVTVIKDRTTGNVLTPDEVEARKQEAEAMKLYQQVLKVGKRGYQSVDDFNKALENIETLRRDYPKFAEQQKDKLAEREAKIRDSLKLYELPAPSPQGK